MRKNFYFFFFILEIEHEWGEGQGGEGEKILSRLHAQHGPRHGARSHYPGIMTWAEIKSRIFHQLSHPGTLRKKLFDKHYNGLLCCFQAGGKKARYPVKKLSSREKAREQIMRASNQMTPMFRACNFVSLLSFSKRVNPLQIQLGTFITLCPFGPLRAKENAYK